MYVKNIVSKDIKLTSFEGYKFVIPPGTSWIWDTAGEHLLTNIYVPNKGPSVDKFGLSNGTGVPGLTRGKETDWVKEGKKVSQVERFRIDANQVPRKHLIKIAQQRGVSSAKITEFLADEQIENSVIAEAINELPVPEEIRFPQVKEQLANE